MPRLCSNCGSEDKPLAACSRCLKAHYCGVECQREHWLEGGHKLECKTIGPPPPPPPNTSAAAVAALGSEEAAHFQHWRGEAKGLLLALGTQLVPRSAAANHVLMVTLKYDAATPEITLDNFIVLTKPQMQQVMPEIIPQIDRFGATWKTSCLPKVPQDGVACIVKCGPIMAIVPLVYDRDQWDTFAFKYSLDAIKIALDNIPLLPGSSSTSSSKKPAKVPPRMLQDVHGHFKSTLAQLRSQPAYSLFMVHAVRLHCANAAQRHLTHCLHVEITLESGEDGDVGRIKSWDAFRVVPLAEARQLCETKFLAGEDVLSRLDVINCPGLLMSRTQYAQNVLIPVLFTLSPTATSEGQKQQPLFMFVQPELYNNNTRTKANIVTAEQADSECSKAFHALQQFLKRR